MKVIVPYFMIKSFLIITSFHILLFGSEQIILVVADEFHSTKARLEFFEDTNILFKCDVNLGKNGLGWGVGEYAFKQRAQEPVKKEGDKKAPAGIFKLTDVFGYVSQKQSSLPYLYADENLICVDETNSNFYNTIIMKKEGIKSFEKMKRDDSLYKLGVVVGHNETRIKGRGSCIFLHVQKAENAPTLGCTSMKYEDLQKIVSMLKKEKNPLLVQIPKSASEEILQKFPQLKNSSLLHPHRP